MGFFRIGHGLAFGLIVIAAVFFVACGGEDDEVETNQEQNQNNDDVPAADYDITVSDQVLEDPSVVTIDSVTTDGDDLWVGIYPDEHVHPGEIIGVSNLVEGAEEPVEDIEVELDDELQDEMVLWAVLHVDDPADGEFTHFDDGDEDPPAEVDGDVVQASFTASLEDEDPDDPVDPAIVVSDQTLEHDAADAVAVDEVTTPEAGYVAIHEGTEDTAHHIVGVSDLLEDETTADLEIELDRDAEDGEVFWAVLYYDDGAGQFDPDDHGDPKTAQTFEVSVEPPPFPEPSITADDQVRPAHIPDVIYVAEVDFAEDGFAVIHEDDDGEPGAVIGTSEILEGDDTPYTNVEVGLDRPVDVEETLWAMLHVDDGSGEFDAATDPPVTEDYPDDEGDVVMDSFRVSLPHVVASDQTLDGADGDLSTVVSVDEAMMQSDGWLVVYEGGCDDVVVDIGDVALEEGRTTDLVVELEQPAAELGESAELCARLHREDSDTGLIGPAVVDANADMIDETFEVTVGEGTPAVRIAITNDDSSSYDVESVEPELFSGHVTEEEDGDDLEFLFRADWRYELINEATGDHPFAFLNDEDEALLSQDDDAPLEAATSIDWVEDGDAMLFTVSDDFRESTGDFDAELQGGDGVVGYWCTVHDSMAGPADYE